MIFKNRNNSYLYKLNTERFTKITAKVICFVNKHSPLKKDVTPPSPTQTKHWTLTVVVVKGSGLTLFQFQTVAPFNYEYIDTSKRVSSYQLFPTPLPSHPLSFNCCCS